MASQFIEGSKHADFTSAVESHFSGGNVGRQPGTDPMLNKPPGGSSAYNGTPMPFESGSGVNYNPTPGHTTK